MAKKRRGSRVPKPEILYALLIKAGVVKVERRKGLPPKITWVKELPSVPFGILQNPPIGAI